ncbi:hypothetical protein BYT27DRAFT_7335470 [Phlegmacium glaucopus]|nr:hypothetical protein BYT27DRAFT_7335470 [Phlegmacium glaucopus]
MAVTQSLAPDPINIFNNWRCIQSNVGYLEQIHVFTSATVHAANSQLHYELARIFSPFSAILFTQSDSYYNPVIKSDAQQFDELVDVLASTGRYDVDKSCTTMPHHLSQANNQFHLRVVIDPQHENADIDEIKPEQTAAYERGEGGIKMGHKILPTANFEFLGDSDVPAPPPPRMELEVASYWSMTTNCSYTTSWIWRPLSTSSRTPFYSDISQIVALGVPTILEKRSDHRATIYVIPRCNNPQYNIDVRRQTGAVEFTPAIS